MKGLNRLEIGISWLCQFGARKGTVLFKVRDYYFDSDEILN